jgi:hypothetical protein
MNRMIALVAASLLSLGIASTAGATPQQEKMKTCNVQAKGKTGDDRKAFMKSCLSGGGAGGAAKSDCEAKAVSKEGKPLAGAAKASFMKKCAAEAGAAK